MLLMKAWLETRWRLTAALAYALLCLALSYRSHSDATANPKGMLMFLGAILVFGAITLAGSGVKSQAPIGFPEGLAGSTQFTITLPIPRWKLLAIRAAVGLSEAYALTAFISVVAWAAFPSVRAIATPADFVRFALTVSLFLTAPYFSSLLFATFLDEPLSLMGGTWAITLLIWLAHHLVPAVDVIRVWGEASPLATHALPYSQLSTCIGLSLFFFFSAVWVVQTREY